MHIHIVIVARISNMGVYLPDKLFLFDYFHRNYGRFVNISVLKPHLFSRREILHSFQVHGVSDITILSDGLIQKEYFTRTKTEYYCVYIVLLGLSPNC